jgi:DNA-binding transcriptional regulator YhcF (GntR family)
MKFQINKKTEFPIYQQLKEQIKYFLLNGDLQPGTRLPSPKDLAGYLRINKNTVIVAYKELEKEGLIVTRHGQGTYASDQTPTVPGEKRKQALIDLAREALDRARELGFSAEDLFTIVFGQTVLGLGRSCDVRALFVECSLPDLHYYVQDLQEEIQISVEGCLLSKLAERMEEEHAAPIDIIITTFFHVEDVKAICEPLEKEVFAIMVAPELSILMQIGQFQPGTRVGFVCASEEGARTMRGSLEVAGIRHVTLQCAGFNDTQGFKDMLGNVDVIVSGRAVIDQVRTAVPEGMAVLEYGNILEKGGINMLKGLLAKQYECKFEGGR